MATHTAGDTLDPERVLSALPHRDRAQFLTEYRAAAEIATHDVSRYRELRQLLRTWHLRAVARAKPGYDASREQARTGRGVFASLDDVRDRAPHGRDP